MILRDKIEIVEGDPPIVVATLAAQVDYRSTSVDTGSGRFKVTEQLVAIVSRFDFDHTTQRIRWRGKTYGPDGSERTVTANGRVHHIEVPLIYVTG